MYNVHKSIKLMGLALFLCTAMTVAATAKLSEAECNTKCMGANADPSLYTCAEGCSKKFPNDLDADTKCDTDCVTTCKQTFCQ